MRRNSNRNLRSAKWGSNGDLAQQQFCEAHVRFGSKADIGAGSGNVRFPEGGHELAQS
jgi:hypothetical protein